MAEVSEAGLKEEEMELDLGLSIGGGFRKAEKLQLVNGFGLDRREKENQTGSSEPESTLLDSQTKREIQALRRQEAKRKREEKRSRGRNEAQTEEQQQQLPAIKRERTETNVNVDVNLNMSNSEMEPRYPFQPGQYRYPPVQFVPYTNGLAYPCAMPCWALGGDGGFRPFQAQTNLANNGCETEQNGGVGKTTSSNGRLGKTGSLNNGSPICSSSTVSDHQSAASHEGGRSCETRSHSSQSLPEKTHLNNGSISKETKAQPEHTDTSNSFESNSQGNDEKLSPKEEPKSENTEPVSIPKPISSNGDSATPTSPLKKITKMDPVAKPPKPQTQTSSLPPMPYVSTTGNGPNGETIHGFLYSYTKSEISIVCVCHGSTFSPAEFVQHAGGTDVSQPLRQITVIPSAFG